MSQVPCHLLTATLFCLQARSQEARSNWETALDSKDRAIEQLEEALASRQRALVRAQQLASTYYTCQGIPCWGVKQQAQRRRLGLPENQHNTMSLQCSSSAHRMLHCLIAGCSIT